MGIKFSVKSSKITQMLDITPEVKQQVASSGLQDGLVTVYIPHTTAGVTINEGADPSVKADIIDTMNEIVPWERVYGHAEGNSPAHIKSSLIGSSVTVILENGSLLLGQWQSIYLCEFDGPRTRFVWVKVLPG